MKTADGIALIRHSALKTGRITQWADLGCGTGFFTNVLSTFLAAGSSITAVDSDASALKKVSVAANIKLTTSALDIIKGAWSFSGFDGIMMANSLHYVRNKDAFMDRLKNHLLPSGLLLIIEYDMSTANAWVPNPITFQSLQTLCKKHGFASVEKINEMPSAFGRAMMYAALVRM